MEEGGKEILSVLNEVNPSATTRLVQRVLDLRQQHDFATFRRALSSFGRFSDEQVDRLWGKNKRRRIDDGLSDEARLRLQYRRQGRAAELRQDLRNRQDAWSGARTPARPANDELDLDDEELAIERRFYTMEENTVEEGYNPFGTTYDEEIKLTAKQAARKAANERWEDLQLRQSGQTRASVNLVIDDELENKVHLVVRETRPPFLEEQQFAHRKENVSAVLDPQSDIAIAARRGSAIVREKRERKERERAVRKAVGVSEPQRPTKNEPELRQSPAKSIDRSALPAFAVRDDLLSCIRDNQVIVCIGETGSGKTTQLTQYLREDGYAEHGMIACTQPRRVAAMSVAKRVAEEMNCSLGGLVGYSIRFEDRTSAQTQIKYLTEGILLREALADKDLDKYSCVIMDEAHERALNTDVLLGLLKGVLRRRRDLKLIITSATLNAQRFSDFFGGAPRFEIPGRTFPVDVLYSRGSVADYVDAAVKQVLNIHLSQGPGDVLVFMTGQEDVEAVCQLVEERLPEDVAPLIVLPIFSTLPGDLQQRIFAPSSARKIIVATNIAETSLTLDGVRFVVDSGFCKLKVYNPTMQMDALQVTPIARSNAQQRSGRAGRTSAGIAYRLYTEGTFRRDLYEAQIPEVQRTNLSNTVLLLKSLSIDLLTFDFMDPPPHDTLMSALYDLWVLGALDDAGDLTTLGRKLVVFPMEPTLSKMLVVASDCLEEILTIVAMLSVPPVFYRPREQANDADTAHSRFAVPSSDHLTLLYVYQQWQSHGRSDNWATDHFLQPRSLRRAYDIRCQLEEICVKQGLRIVSGSHDQVRRRICQAFFHQAARLRSVTEYVNLRTSMAACVHPTSALCGSLPEYVVYHQVTLTSALFMSTVTEVDPRWLAEDGAVFYSVRGEPIRERSKQVTLMGERPRANPPSPVVSTRSTTSSVVRPVKRGGLGWRSQTPRR
ncbi:hypothetical protein PYCC9005_000597 [Savitreella phatthalungensis]